MLHPKKEFSGFLIAIILLCFTLNSSADILLGNRHITSTEQSILPPEKQQTKPYEVIVAKAEEAYSSSENPELLVKLDPELMNASFLEEQGYLQRDIVKVIVRLTCESTSYESAIEGVGSSLMAAYPDLSLAIVDLPYSKLSALSSVSWVDHIYLDRKATCLLDNSLALIQPPSEWSIVTQQYGILNGSGIKIAILDTGIDASHPDFFFPNGTSKIIAAHDFTEENDTADKNGHGTHCASIAAGTGAASNGKYIGVAPEAQIINAKVLKNSGSGSESWVISAIHWSVAQGANILSLSLGESTPNTDGSDPVSQAIDWATNQGVVCCAAAGNNGRIYGDVSSPACAKTAVAVGAYNSSGSMADFSSYGPTIDNRVKPDVVAPGVNIAAARANGTSSGTIVNQYYTSLSGTSMATPYVAGAAALLIQAHPYWTPQQIKVAIIESANLSVLNPSDDVLAVGGGLIDIANAVTVTTFASKESISFFMNQSYLPTNLSTTLSFSPPTGAISLQKGKCASNLEMPFTYKNANLTFSCPANTTSEWCGRIVASGGCLFKENVSVPVMAVTEFSPPEISTWLENRTVSASSVSPLIQWASVFAVQGDRLYVADSYYSGVVMECTLPDLTLLRNVTLPEKMINSLAIIGGCLFAGTTYGFVFKISLSTFAVDSKTAVPNYTGITKLLTCKNSLFVATYNGSIFKVNPENLSIVSSKSLDTDIQSGIVANSTLYFVTSRGNIWRVDPLTLNAIKINLGENGFGLNSLTSAGENLYAIANNYYGRPPYTFGFFPQVFKLSYDLSCQDQLRLKFPTSESLALSCESGRLYVMAHYSLNQSCQINHVLRINLSTFMPDAAFECEVSVNRTPGFFSDQPFVAGTENVMAWSDHVILSTKGGQLVLTEDYSPDSAEPTFISLGSNSTRAGQPVVVSALWHSSLGLSGFIAGSNSSGKWENQTWQPLTGKISTANFTFTLNGTENNVVAVEFWCNDSTNQWSNPGMQILSLTPANYNTLEILSSQGVTNPVLGNHTYPAETAVTVWANTTNNFAFAYWILDGTIETANPIVVNMNQSHTLFAETAATNDVVKWEEFTPVRTRSSMLLFGYPPVMSYHSLPAPTRLAQVFTVGNTSHTLKSIKLYVGKIGNPYGPVTVSLLSTLNGVPYGPDLANGTLNLDDFPKGHLSVSQSLRWLTINMTYPASSITLDPNSQYAIVVRDSSDNDTNCVTWGSKELITEFSGGNLYRPLNTTGNDWQVYGEADELFVYTRTLFQVWGTVVPPAPTPSPSPTSAPTVSPTPTANPTAIPTPTSKPTPSPKPTQTSTPTAIPTSTPTPTVPTPTQTPPLSPSPSPTRSPVPTSYPTQSVTPQPTAHSIPSTSPTPITTSFPSEQPTIEPTSTPNIPQSENLLLLIIVVLATVALIALGSVVRLKRRKGKN